uniref:(northern house mosquito) hypothetical protein n=1 Tax=Culex pipiens TaxID=7175 RepID=A0A8D8AYD7_CULPI
MLISHKSLSFSANSSFEFSSKSGAVFQMLQKHNPLSHLAPPSFAHKTKLLPLNTPRHTHSHSKRPPSPRKYIIRTPFFQPGRAAAVRSGGRLRGGRRAGRSPQQRGPLGQFRLQAGPRPLLVRRQGRDGAQSDVERGSWVAWIRKFIS